MVKIRRIHKTSRYRRRKKKLVHKQRSYKLAREPRKITGLKPKAPYRSLFEEKLAFLLKQDRSGAEYEKEKLPYTITYNYVPDWTLPNGVIIEAKGYLDFNNKKKLLAVKKANPDRIFCLIFQKASNKFRKDSETTYADWATKNGFLWSEGKPDPEWYKIVPPKKEK